MRNTLAVAAVLCVAALALLAVPATANHTSDADDGGGDGAVLVEITLHGTTAENVTLGNATVRERVATELEVAPERVVTVTDDGSTAVEVRAADVSTAELERALSAAGAAVEAGEVRQGVTDGTQQEAARTVETRLRALGPYNGSVVRTNESGLVVRVESRPTRAELDRLVLQGNVTLSARLPDNRTVAILSNEDFRGVGSVREGSGVHSFPVELTRDSAERFTDELVRLNFTDEGVDACEGRPAPDARGYCLVVALDGEPVTAAGVTSQFAAALRQDQFVDVRQFWLVTGNASDAHDLRLSVVADPLPTTAAIDGVTQERTATPTPTATAGTQTSTPTASQTPTSTATPAPSSTPTETPGDGGPGFTPLVALVALATALLASRRR